MRVKIAGPVSVRSGQTANITAKLGKGCDYAYVTVFSSSGDVEPSPYVPAFKGQLKRKGLPEFVTPTSVRLTRELRPSHKLAITVDEDCSLYLMQEVDVATDARAKGRISNNDQGFFKAILVYAFRWLYRDTKR